ncbi:hypothetical protein DFH08DRAFT_962033 [Mycena albidolilacea]|uniref:Uncharacterized protein n=1 Tax=Mycena albidolilacea TaxID=1033008 RepID=A0AAD6ZZ76_9AGAR|nr:hypothetical protein DFH08DRAFT_962033 [Mycena albidolilacea]
MLVSSNRMGFATNSSVPSTIWGPSTLAGRALLALGEAMLKGLDRIIDRESRTIQKRFAVIRASVPHLTPKMYSDLIELSRHAHPYIREAASDILFCQLHLGYEAAIALAVAQLPLLEARLVVFPIVTWRQLEACDTPETALNFLATLVQVRPELKSACFAVLDELARNLHVCIRFRDHPIMRIHAEEDLNIPLICRTPLAELQLRFSEDPMYRWKNWRLLESGGCSSEIRLLHINTVLLDAVSESWYWTPDFFDAAVDLFDFLRYSPVPESHQSATDHLVHCISATRDSWEPLSVILDFLSHFPTAGDVPMYGPTSPSDSEPHKKTQSDECHPQLRAFLRYAHLQPHARDVHLRFRDSRGSLSLSQPDSSILPDLVPR